MTDKSELLPCPFCGGEAKLFQDCQVSEPDNWFARCDPCDLIREQAFQATREEVIAAWNTRKALAAQPSDDELLRAAREDMAMCISEIARARGRLEALSTCNEDRRIASALGATLDHLRRRWFASETRIDARLNGEKP